MIRKILLSAGMLVFVGAAVAGATGAFFNDVETSTGNTFAAGEIDLTVDSEQHYNGNECAVDAQDINNNQNIVEYVWQGPSAYPVPGSICDGTWLATDLGAQKFFNFNDIKPGDEGENTISLHVDSNDAYACVDVNITSNDDNDCTEPENDVEGANCPQVGEPDGDFFDGDLAQGLTFFAWADYGAVPGFQGNDPLEGDNIWQATEAPLFSNVVGSSSDALDGESYTLADSNVGPLVGGSTSYIGLAWCAGTFVVNAPGSLTCNGASMGNEAQTDSMVANIAFRIEQARNNPSFICLPQGAPVVGDDV